MTLSLVNLIPVLTVIGIVGFVMWIRERNEKVKTWLSKSENRILTFPLIIGPTMFGIAAFIGFQPSQFATWIVGFALGAGMSVGMWIERTRRKK